MYTKILCPVDGSDTSKFSLQEAIKIANACKAQLCILHIVDTFYPYLDSIELANSQMITEAMRERGEKILEETKHAASQAGVRVETKLVEILTQKISDSILEQAKIEKADLIVIGTHGRRGFDRLVMGSDAESVVRSSEIPVMTVRHPE